MPSGIDVFVLISGSFSIVATVPLIYLATRSVWDARELKRVQLEVAGLVEEVHEIQREIHHDQRTAKTEILETKGERRARRPGDAASPPAAGSSGVQPHRRRTLSSAL